MNPRRILTILALLGAFVLPFNAEEPVLRDLTDAKLTPEMLVEALKPSAEADPERAVRARGFSDAPSSSCKTANLRSRGLSESPTAAVALHITFDFNSSQISPEAESDLDALGRALLSPELQPYCFSIEGHTDAIGSERYNLELSRKRGDAVQSYLTEKFRIDPGRLLIVGRGESQPLAPNTTEAGRRRNRRVQVLNLGSGG